MCISPNAINLTDTIENNGPNFSRLNWDFVDYSIIYYNDPTIYLNDEIKGGWGIGNAENWYLKNISQILKEICVNLKIEFSNLYLFGSSMGGFMSLMLGTMIKDSKVIADIPQFICKHGINYIIIILKKYLLNEKK